MDSRGHQHSKEDRAAPATQLCTAAQLRLQQLMLNSCMLLRRLFLPLVLIPSLFNWKRKTKTAIATPLLVLFRCRTLAWGAGDRNFHDQECFSSSPHAGLNLMSDLLAPGSLSVIYIYVGNLGFLWSIHRSATCRRFPFQ